MALLRTFEETSRGVARLSFRIRNKRFRKSNTRRCSFIKWSCVVLCLLLAKGGDAVSELCLTCLCEAASQCDLKLRCENDACGPFQITYLYWVDGGKRGTGWETCSMDLQCATDTVRGYMDKYQKDCDGDGQTDCEDYARIHKLGGVGCVNEPDEGFDDFKSDLDTCLAEVNASMPGIP